MLPRAGPLAAGDVETLPPTPGGVLTPSRRVGNGEAILLAAGQGEAAPPAPGAEGCFRAPKGSTGAGEESPEAVAPRSQERGRAVVGGGALSVGQGVDLADPVGRGRSRGARGGAVDGGAAPAGGAAVPDETAEGCPPAGVCGAAAAALVGAPGAAPIPPRGVLGKEPVSTVWISTLP